MQVGLLKTGTFLLLLRGYLSSSISQAEENRFPCQSSLNECAFQNENDNDNDNDKNDNDNEKKKEEGMQAYLRKCCLETEVLYEVPSEDGQGIAAKCAQIPSNERIPDLQAEKDQLAEEIRNASSLENMFSMISNISCPGKKYLLDPDTYNEDSFAVQANGTLHLPFQNLILLPGEYCIDWHRSRGKIAVIVCLQPEKVESTSTEPESIKNVGVIVSIPFLICTFLVYAIVPELQNLYGKTLMCYVGCLIAAYGSLTLATFLPIYLRTNLCAFVAFVIHFSFLASFCWLNVMCFDIWWTFGGFRSLRGSVKQRERKKFIVYSIYAWGVASIFTGICLIMQFAPTLPEYIVRPHFGQRMCWFSTNAAKAIYFYGPMSISVFCNVCLFISTALKIIRHKRDTAHQLRGSESRRHDENKQWFNLYLKLFIVMGINWSMEIVSWLFNNEPQWIWYLTDLVNTLQGVIIFVIFVWKDKIKRLLLKRLGFHDRNVLSRNSTRSAYHSSASRTCTTLATPLQEKIDPYHSREMHRADQLSRNGIQTTTTTTTATTTTTTTTTTEDSDCV